MNADGLPEAAAPPPGLVVVGRYDQLQGYGVDRPRGADSWLFTWTTGGHGRLRQGAAETRAGAGDLVVLALGVRHEYGVELGARSWQFWWVHCQARPAWSPWLRPYDTGDGLFVVTPTPATLHDRVGAAFRRMLADARWTGTDAPPATAPDDRVAVAHGTAARELALSSLEEIVLLTAATARLPSPPPGTDPRVRHAEALIAADPGAPHTVRSLAERVAVALTVRPPVHPAVRAVPDAGAARGASAPCRKASGEYGSARGPGGRGLGVRQPLPLQPRLPHALRCAARRLPEGRLNG